MKKAVVDKCFSFVNDRSKTTSIWKVSWWFIGGIFTPYKHST